MEIFSKKKNENELLLVFDVGSSKVGGTLFQAQKSGVPKIIFAAAEPVSLEEKLDIDRFSSKMLQSLQIVTNKIYMAGKGAPQSIFCVLSCPWHSSQTRIINFKKNTPFLFTEKLADSLVQKEVNLFKEEYLKEHKNIGGEDSIIELKNIKTVLNGYETPQPINQKAMELEMTIFISLCEKQILKNIEDAIKKHFYFDRVRFSSFAMSSFAVIRGMNMHQGNFLLVDIGGEVTNITMVKNNILRESVSFPLGSNFLIRDIASGMSLSLDQASSTFSLFGDGHIEPSIEKKMVSFLDQLKIKWLKDFQESLAGLSNDIFIPSTVYLTVGKNLANFFSQTIKSEQFNQYTLTESKFEVIHLDSQIFHEVAILNETVIDEPNLVIDSIYINRFLTHSDELKQI